MEAIGIILIVAAIVLVILTYTESTGQVIGAILA